MSGTIAIGNTIALERPIVDHSGIERPAGDFLMVEKFAHEYTRHPIVLATPTNWTRHQLTHRTLHDIAIGRAYCFYLDDLELATAQDAESRIDAATGEGRR
jgi:hypothetical protein